MEFGRIPHEQLPFTEMILPDDPAITTSTLTAGASRQPVQVHVGCAKWGRKEWVGKIYPVKTKEADFLEHYVTHFDCIELNATFYQTYGPETIAKWKEKAAANPDFKFCPKFSQSISHIRRLKNAEEITTAFYEGVLAFGDMLGPMFLQLGDNYTPKSFPELKAYLQHLPTDQQVFVEVRHKSWYADEAIRHELFDTLKDLNIGAVITDAAGRRDCVHMELPTPHAFIRFVGNSLDKSDYHRVDDWVKRIKGWADKGLQSVWFFMHQHDERYSPELADYVSDELNKALDLNLRRPQFISRDEGLFS